MADHLWKAFRYDPDGTYETMRCPLQTWKCEHCQTKIDTPAEADPKNYEQTSCSGLQTQLKEKWKSPNKNGS